MKYYLAQVNIARLLYPIDHPAIAGFVNQLDTINALAEHSQGFVWRLKDDSNSAVNIQVFNDPLIITNLSVWESIGDLKQFVYQSTHLDVFKDRKKWFQKLQFPHMAMWWHKVGHTMPDAFEGKRRLEHLKKYGPGAYAFNFGKVIGPGV